MRGSSAANSGHGACASQDLRWRSEAKPDEDIPPDFRRAAPPLPATSGGPMYVGEELIQEVGFTIKVNFSTLNDKSEHCPQAVTPHTRVRAVQTFILRP